MFNKVTLLLTAMLSIAVLGRAQDRCATDEKYWELVKQNPQILEYEQQIENQIKNNIGNIALGKTTLSPYDTTMFDVPVVVHVVHDYGAEYLADDDIYNAVAYWATIYVKQNADTSSVIDPFIPYIGNPRIRLHMATIDPNGQPTKSVVRHHSYLTGNADDQAKIGQWPPNKYINVWFIRQFGASATGAAAYAYYPAAAAGMPYYDGVIGLYSYLNYDKAIPHEIGHVMNLQHPWGNTNAPAVACGDDLVDDTPPTMGHNPTGCTAASLYDTVCASGYVKVYTSVLGTDSVVDYPDTTNAQNIMDYTYCQRMFTKGQVVRMRNALTNSVAGRNNLYTAANLAATGALAPRQDLPPIADFSVEHATGGGLLTDNRTCFMTFNNARSFSFRNRSWNDTVSDVSWSFSNGALTPTSTGMAVVTNQFSTPGWVTVSLIANSNAGSDTLVNANAVYAADTAAIPVSGYVQSFSSPAAIANWPMMNYFENQYKWEFYTGASTDGDNTCIRYRSFDTTAKHVATPLGDHDDFYTPAFNFSGVSGPYYINFQTAAAKASSAGLGWGTTAVGDSLEIDASTNGGVVWTKIAGFKPSQLENNPTYGYEFVPTAAANWVGRAVSIPAVSFSAQTFFRFRYWPGNIGNDFYMDHMYLYPYPVGLDETNKTNTVIKLYPNPSTYGSNILFNSGKDGAVSYVVKDVSGRVIYAAKKQYQANTVINEPISREVTQASGLYFVTVVIDGLANTEKLVVY